MKYKNALTQSLLKEFRKFTKWNPKGCYVFGSDINPEEEFNKNIREILKRYDIIVGGEHK